MPQEVDGGPLVTDLPYDVGRREEPDYDESAGEVPVAQSRTWPDKRQRADRSCPPQQHRVFDEEPKPCNNACCEPQAQTALHCDAQDDPCGRRPEEQLER